VTHEEDTYYRRRRGYFGRSGGKDADAVRLGGIFRKDPDLAVFQKYQVGPHRRRYDHAPHHIFFYRHILLILQFHKETILRLNNESGARRLRNKLFRSGGIPEDRDKGHAEY